MKIAIIGATGFIGQHILNEAAFRQHQVTALARNPEKVPTVLNVEAIAIDISDVALLKQTLADQDALVVSVHYENKNLENLINNIKSSGVKRVLFVGGAASLEVAPGVQLFDTPNFPDIWKETADAARNLLSLLRGEKSLNWVYVSPSAIIEPGARTVVFRLGKDQLLTNEKGESVISNQDFAVAVINELETPVHTQIRFTVGY